MVSINTSTSLLGTKKPDESGSDNNTSGIENIFASMLTMIEEKDRTEAGESESKKSGSVLGLLEKIKKEINANRTRLINNNLSDGRSDPSSSNILKLYQTYKTIIDEAIEIADDATVSFDIKRLTEIAASPPNTRPNLGTKTDLPSQQSTKSLSNDQNLSKIGAINESIEDFSELEMQRVKASMKQSEQGSSGLIADDNKKNLAVKHVLFPTSKGMESEAQSNKKSNKEQNFLNSKINVENKIGSQTTDLPKIESLIEQNQLLTRSTPNKLSSMEQSSQMNQTSSETHLKLLEKNWGKDLAKIIEKAILSGKDKIDISLDPQKLGKMQLTLSVVNNQTSIFISTENAAASLILTSAEERLAQMFEASGLKLSNFQANSNRGKNSDQNGSQSKSNKNNPSTSKNKELVALSTEKDSVAYTADGRKIINLIA